MAVVVVADDEVLSLLPGRKTDSELRGEAFQKLKFDMEVLARDGGSGKDEAEAKEEVLCVESKESGSEEEGEEASGRAGKEIETPRCA